VITLWVLFIRSAVHLWLVLAVFAILQVPLLLIPKRADTATRAEFPVHDLHIN
jgi:hypothetical protein